MQTAIKPNPLSKKLQTIFHTSLDDPETLKALAALEDFNFTDSTLKDLRTQVDARMSLINDDLLTHFTQISEEMDQMGSALINLRQECSNMEETLQNAITDTKDIISKTANLKLKSQILQTQHALADKFLDKFTLTDEDLNVLTTETLNQDFFRVFEKTFRISVGCEALPEPSSTKILQQISSIQDTAFSRISKYVMASMYLLSEYEPFDIPVIFRKSIQTLRRRPLLLAKIITELELVREKSILHGFHLACVVGGPNGFPKPIEFHAHDAHRYISDLLGWVHQMALNERELLETLFGVYSQTNKQRVVVDTEDLFKYVEGYDLNQEQVETLLDNETKSLGNMLSKRIDSVLGVRLGCLTLYKIANLLQFYSLMVEKSMSPNATLVKVLKDRWMKANGFFLACLEMLSTEILDTKMSLLNLEMPPWVKDYLLQMKEILNSFDMSMVAKSQQGLDLLESIFKSYVDSILQVCDQSSQNLKSLDRGIAKINCILQIENTIKSFDFSKQRLESLNQMMELQTQFLMKEQCELMLSNSGLDVLYKDIQKLPKPLSKHSETSREAIIAAMSKFDDFLLDTTDVMSFSMVRIQSKPISERVIMNGARLFLQCFKEIRDAIFDKENLYEVPEQLVTRSVVEVETLLTLTI